MCKCSLEGSPCFAAVTSLRGFLCSPDPLSRGKAATCTNPLTTDQKETANPKPRPSQVLLPLLVETRERLGSLTSPSGFRSGLVVGVALQLTPPRETCSAPCLVARSRMHSSSAVGCVASTIGRLCWTSAVGAGCIPQPMVAVMQPPVIVLVVVPPDGRGGAPYG